MSLGRGRAWSECPLGETGTFPHNTLQARIHATGAPTRAHQWTFKTFPDALRAHDPEIFDAMRDWAMTATPSPPALLLTGPPGVGKTGLAIAALNTRAAWGDGEAGVWNVVTAPGYIEAVATGTMRPRPAPCHYTTWPDLSSLLWMSSRYGTPAWKEEPMFCELKVRGELEAQTSLLVLDELSRDRDSAMKYTLLSSWYEELFVDKRMILVANHPFDSTPFREAVGDSMVDRFSDSSRFLRLSFPFPSGRE